MRFVQLLQAGERQLITQFHATHRKPFFRPQYTSSFSFFLVFCTPPPSCFGSAARVATPASLESGLKKDRPSFPHCTPCNPRLRLRPLTASLTRSLLLSIQFTGDGQGGKVDGDLGGSIAKRTEIRLSLHLVAVAAACWTFPLALRASIR